MTGNTARAFVLRDKTAVKMSKAPLVIEIPVHPQAVERDHLERFAKEAGSLPFRDDDVLRAHALLETNRDWHENFKNLACWSRLGRCVLTSASDCSSEWSDADTSQDHGALLFA